MLGLFRWKAKKTLQSPVYFKKFWWVWNMDESDSYKVLLTFSRYAWVVPLKGKEDITITSSFQKVLMSLKYGWVRVATFETDIWRPVAWQWHCNVFNTQWRKICCCWDLSKLWGSKSTNIWLRYQKWVHDKLHTIVPKYNNTQ